MTRGNTISNSICLKASGLCKSQNFKPRSQREGSSLRTAQILHAGLFHRTIVNCCHWLRSKAAGVRQSPRAWEPAVSLALAQSQVKINWGPGLPSQPEAEEQKWGLQRKSREGRPGFSWAFLCRRLSKRCHRAGETQAGREDLPRARLQANATGSKWGHPEGETLAMKTCGTGAQMPRRGRS